MILGQCSGLGSSLRNPDKSARKYEAAPFWVPLERFGLERLCFDFVVVQLVLDNVRPDVELGRSTWIRLFIYSWN